MIKKYFLLILIFFPVLSFSQNAEQIRELELYVLKGNYDSSIVIANELLKSDSTNWEIYFYLGKSYQSKYKYFDAIKFFEKANALDTSNSIIENSLAASFDFIGKDEDAISIYYDQYLRDTLDLDPIVNLANLFRKKKEFGSAIYYYQKANAIDPTNFYYFKQLAYCYDKINVIEGAIFSYQIAIQLNPYDLSMYLQLANILNSQRNFVTAIDVCNNGLIHFSDNTQLLKLKSYAQYLNRDFDSSIAGFNKLLQQGDSTYFNLKYQGLAFFEKKDFNRAIRNLNVAIEYDNKDAESMFYLGSAMGRAGKHEDGMNYLNKSLSLLEPSPIEVSNIFSEIAFIYQEQKEYEVALEHLKAAYKYDSKPILSFKMAQLYDILGNKKLAVNYYDGFLIMVNPPESDEIKIETDSPRITDQAMIDHAKTRIRILKEEMFFEETKSE